MSVPYAINLTPDPAVSMAMERVYANVDGLGVAEQDVVTIYGPCITILIVADDVHLDDVLETVQRHVHKTHPFTVTFTEPCIIHGSPPTLSVRVNPAGELLAIHNAIYRSLPEAATHLHYRPAYWQPHLKLANVSPDRLVTSRLLATMATTWQPITGDLIGLEVIHYLPVESIWRARFPSPNADSEAPA